jgi:hypothetical protein
MLNNPNPADNFQTNSTIPTKIESSHVFNVEQFYWCQRKTLHLNPSSEASAKEFVSLKLDRVWMLLKGDTRKHLESD